MSTVPPKTLAGEFVMKIRVVISQSSIAETAPSWVSTDKTRQLFPLNDQKIVMKYCKISKSILK